MLYLHYKGMLIFGEFANFLASCAKYGCILTIQESTIIPLQHELNA